MPTVQERIAHITTEAQKAKQITRKAFGLTEGQWIRQGDIQIVPVFNGKVSLKYRDQTVTVKWSDFTVPVTERQLVAGQSVGSRHCVAGECRISRPQTPHPLIAAGLSVANRGDCTITHPTHGHVVLDAGDYVIFQQRDLAAEELAAVRD